MGPIHAGLAWLAVLPLAAVLVTAALTASGRLRTYRALDRLVLVQLATALLAALSGVAAAVALRPPGDPLHLLYGAVVTAGVVGTRVAAQGRPARSIGRWVAIASLVALGATVRSFMTGH